ncbi:nucleotide exchange factor GrpE [Acetobacterium fimetarium]|uniref:Protein GrpE n=1 Tax=Acetobacterium fimetarium TaxID=52691 RepID=A0ABR6WXV8_9FIRM|nr:nucleotide exchange factor GrpE [Acetobacterium fimetarium]MBC3805434.1 nucleotide exchange factor GrpE [Acetobacterium fimetarium]
MMKEEENKTEIRDQDILDEKTENVTADADVSSDEPVVEETPAEEAKAEETKETVKEDEAVLERMIRLQADFENFKKRSQKEKTEIYQYAAENFATKLLPVMDNLERAESSLTDVNEEAKSIVDGLQMVFKQLKDILKEEGLEEVSCDGQFDPNLHHGVAVGEDDEKEDQAILEVFQKGYSFKGKVIRPAMVKVCNK